MKSALKTVKGLGSARNGIHHWWLQRLTAIALIFLSVWFVAKMMCVTCHERNFQLFLSNKLHLVIFVTFLIVALLHSTLGIKVIVEDYITNEKSKFVILIFTNLLAWFTAILLLSLVII
jgi:succinate dehydrogenase / fumarate reductase membrane anchor subunit